MNRNLLELNDEEIIQLVKQIKTKNPRIGITQLAREILKLKYSDFDKRKALQEPLRQKLYRLFSPREKSTFETKESSLEQIWDSTLLSTRRWRDIFSRTVAGSVDGMILLLVISAMSFAIAIYLVIYLVIQFGLTSFAFFGSYIAVTCGLVTVLVISFKIWNERQTFVKRLD